MPTLFSGPNDSDASSVATPFTPPATTSAASGEWSVPIGARPDLISDHAPRQSRRWLWLTIILVLLIGIGTGGYFAWSRGFLSLPFITPTSAKVVDKMINSLSGIENAQYSLRFKLSPEPRTPGAQPLTAVSGDVALISSARQYVLGATFYADRHEGSYPPCPDGATSCDPAAIMELKEFFTDGTPPDLPAGYDPLVYRLVAANGNPAGSFELAFSLKVGTAGYAAGPCTATPYVGEGGGSGIFQCTNTKSSTNADRNTNSFQVEPVGGQIGLGGVSSVFPGGLELNSFYQSLPADLSVEAGVTLNLQTDRSLKEADGSIRIDGTYTGGDASAAFDLEARKVKENFYALVSKFPSLFFFDLSGIKGKWIKLSPGDSSWYPSAHDLEETDLRGSLADLQRVLRAIFEHDFLTVDAQLAPETIQGVRSEHYRIQANLDRLSDVYRALIEDQRNRGESVIALEADLQKLESPEVRHILDRIRDNTTFEVWIDRTNGYLRQLRWSLRIVPPESVEKLKDKQFVATTTLTLDKINEPTNVEIPSQTIDLDEATRLVTGITKEEQEFDKQRARVNKVRGALTYAKTGFNGLVQPATNAYPERLSDLVSAATDAKATCEARRTNANDNANRSYQSCDWFDSYIPRENDLIDLYTGQLFGYERNGDGYRLTYTMRIPTDRVRNYGTDEFAEGTNTATPNDLSLEKTSVSEQYRLDHPPTNSSLNVNLNRPVVNTNSSINLNLNTNTNTRTLLLDADGDGLSDTYEGVMGTDPKKTDTDGDGYDDGTEIQSGYDPRGPGRQSDGAWSGCVNLSNFTPATCTSYCTSVGKTCWNAGTTTGGASAQGAETWDDGPACSTASGTTKWNTCDFQTAATDARWKCFCK